MLLGSKIYFQNLNMHSNATMRSTLLSHYEAFSVKCAFLVKVVFNFLPDSKYLNYLR